MTDEELLGYLRRSSVGYTHPLRLAADRIETLVKVRREDALELLAAHGQAQEAYEAQLKAEARAERLEAALHEIDALDPEFDHIGACSENAIRGLVLRMGEIARAALKGADHE